MTANSKLAKVLEHLVKGEEELARDLLHQVFIDKARAIHEELMNDDEVTHEEEMDEGVVVTIENDVDHVGGTGDEGRDLTDEIKAMDNEIDFEETMSEDDEEIEVTGDVATDDIVDDVDSMDAEVDADIDMDAEVDADMADDTDATVASVESKFGDLEQALEDLKAEFEKLENDAAGVDAEDDVEVADAADDEMDAEVDAADDVADAAADDAEDDDTWALDEEFDELAESLELEVVTKNMEKTVPAADVGAAKSGMSDGNNAKSVVPPSQTSRFGAKPVAIGKGPDVNGYKLETAPKSDDINIGNSNKDNRRKKATDGTKKVSKEGSVQGALLNQNVPTDGKMSPLSKGGQNLKS